MVETTIKKKKSNIIKIFKDKNKAIQIANQATSSAGNADSSGCS